MTKYAVIGSNAFSGQDFVDLLLDDPNAEVIGISRSEERPDYLLRYKERADLSAFSFHQLDMNTQAAELLELLDRERPEYIVNFAAQSEVGPSWQHPEHWFETNTVGLSKLVKHLTDCDYLQKYLHISSPEAYGSADGFLTEDTQDNPSTPYAASKAAADMINAVYHREFGFPVTTVRATNVYGARQQLFKIVNRAIIYAKSGRKLRLDGGGVAVKSYIHVRDVSRGELAILHHGLTGERYHLSPDGGISIADLVRIICDSVGVSFEEFTEIGPERPGQDAAYLIDSSKAREKFAWEPSISLEEGIDECVRWIETYWRDIKNTELEYRHKA